MKLRDLYTFFDSEATPPLRPSFSTDVTLLVLALAVMIVAGGISALIRIDFPLIQFLRATPVQLLADLGRFGNRLGHGSTLVIFSVLMILVGYVLKQHRYMQVGFQTLVAHGAAGLLTQIVKHTLGRPRPRLMHQDHWEVGPSFQSGIDAFPSGHSSASFAVAAVVVRYFPGYGWVVYGGAIFVALSRIVKGSHFPTDACVGAFLGYVVGYVLSRPLPHWRTTVIQALARGLPGFVCALGLFWIAVQKPTIEVLYDVVIGVGVLVVAIGYSIRVRALVLHEDCPNDTRLTMSSLLIALGLALCTGSFLITVLATMAGLAWWMVYTAQSQTEGRLFRKGWEASFSPIVTEVMIAFCLVVSVGLIYELRGIIPLV